VKALIFALVGVLLLLIACAPAPKTTVQLPKAYENLQNAREPTTDELASGNIHKLALKIEGMNCPFCAQGVQAQLQQVPGVLKADVSYSQGAGIVLYDASKTKPETIAAASTSYPATVVSDERYAP
jgi:copper chaperone CopZ